MSLMIDILKKVKKQPGSGSVPPGMINLAPKKRAKAPSKLLLVLLAVVVLGGGIVFYLDSGKPKYKVLNTPQQTAKPAATKPKAKDEDVQARIDAAVQKALSDANKKFEDQLKSNADSNRQRLTVVDALPKTAEAKAKEIETITKAAAKQDAEAAQAETAEKKAESAAVISQLSDMQNAPATDPFGPKPIQISAESVQNTAPQKPVMSASQRDEFNKKIEYNTAVAIADRAMREGRYEKAVDSYEEVLRMKVKKSSLMNMIKAKIALGRFDSAEASMRQYRRIVDEDVVSAVADEYSRLGVNSRGFKLLENYLGRFDSDSRLYYTAGRLHESEQGYEKAEEAYKKAVELIPVDAYNVYAYARMLDQNQKFKEAAEQYRKVIPLDAPRNMKVSAAARAGLLEDYLKKKEEAEAAEKAKKTESASADKVSEQTEN